MTFTSESFTNLDAALGQVVELIKRGEPDTALQGLRQIRDRLPALQAGIEAEVDRLLER